MKKTFELSILDHKFVFRSDNDEKQVKKIADYVNKKMHEIVESNKAISTANVAILAALNIADEYYKVREDYRTKLKRWADHVRQLVGAL